MKSIFPVKQAELLSTWQEFFTWLDNVNMHKFLWLSMVDKKFAGHTNKNHRMVISQKDKQNNIH